MTTDTTANNFTAPTMSPEARQTLIKEINTKWGKFSEQEASVLKNQDELVAQVRSKYSLDDTQARRQVDDFFKSRAV